MLRLFESGPSPQRLRLALTDAALFDGLSSLIWQRCCAVTSATQGYGLPPILALDDTRKASFRFHHISTDEVYGDLEGPEDLFTETTSYYAGRLSTV
jgi:hypothetical protein